MYIVDRQNKLIHYCTWSAAEVQKSIFFSWRHSP